MAIDFEHFEGPQGKRPKTERGIRLDELNLLSQWGSRQESQEMRTALAWYVLGRVKEMIAEGEGDGKAQG